LFLIAYEKREASRTLKRRRAEEKANAEVELKQQKKVRLLFPLRSLLLSALE